jgi:LytS/YehU family sensor histidine kinase
LGELSTLIRRVLENSEKEFISLKEELFVCETYIKLEQKRFDDKFNYSIHNEENLDLSKINIPPLLLQPFIENAIWHGLLHKSENAQLQISVTNPCENDIIISINDNGVGRNGTKQNLIPDGIKNESLGINLTMNRINVNNFVSDLEIKLQINDLVDIDNNPCGTEVTITLHKI